MAAVETESVLEVIEALDFEPEVRCAAVRPGHGMPQCEQEAKWYLTCRQVGCGLTIPFCDEHLELARTLAMLNGGMRCSECRVPSRTFAAGVRVTPIRGRR